MKSTHLTAVSENLFSSSKVLANFGLAVMLILGVTSMIFAQGDLGSIAGTVTDSNGAVISGATLTVKNTLNGQTRTVTTNESGNYTIPNLNVGDYEIIVNAQGFSENKVENVKVSVAFTNTVNITLNPSGVSGEVEVSATTTDTSVNTNDQQLSTLISNKKILDLPLLSRDPNSLVLLSPGTVQSTSGLGGAVINGQRERNNNFLVDGVDNNDTDVPGILGGVATPNIDATEEFRVITNNFLPEFGRNTGGIITVATRRGTNEFHGGGYIFYRSDAFAARNFFDTTGSPDPLQRRQFGGTIGGPIIKDRTFFFFNAERDIFDQGITQTRTVPSAQARQGIFNLTALGLGIIDARQSSSNNILGLPIIPSLTSYLNAIYPLGNAPGEGVLPGVFDTYRFSTQTNDKNTQFSTRVDHRFNDKHSLSGSLNFSKGSFEFCCETFPGLDDAIRSPQKGYVVSLQFGSSFTANLFNEFRFGVNRLDASFTGAGDEGVSPTAALAALAAVSGAGSPVLNDSGENGSFINLGIGGISSAASFDTQGRRSGTITFSDSLTWIKGNHQFKFGQESRLIYSNGATNFGRQEFINFSLPTTFGFPILRDNNGNPISLSGIRGTVQNFASYLYSLVASQSQSQYFDAQGQRTVDDERRFRQNEFDFFFQDSWKIRPNFTFNYGVRYEFKGVPYEMDGLLSTLVNQDPSDPTPAGGFEFTILEKGDLLYQNDYNNFAPRVGFAYSPDFKSGFMRTLFGEVGTSSIRGGFGIFYDRIFGNLFSNSRGNPPFQQDFFEFTGDTLDNVTRPPVQVPSRFVQDDSFIFPVIFALPGNNDYQSKFATPYTQSWNFGIQRQFGNSFLFEADYVGSSSRNLLRVVDGNRTSVDRVNSITGSNNSIDPFSGVNNFFNGSLNTAFFQSALNLSVGRSNYHAGQFRVTKRLDNKFGTGEFQAFYTYSHSIDDAADPLVGQAGERTFPRDSSGFVGGWTAERGSSGFDVRHNFVLNGIYELPFKNSNPFVNQIVSGWTLTGILRSSSGRPYSIFGGTDSAGTGLSQRADFVGAGNGLTATQGLDPRTQTGPTRDQFDNPLPNADGTGRQGNVARSAYVGPAFNTVDFSVIKRFRFGRDDRYSISARADFFNLFNTVNFSQPVNTINSLNFGQSLSAGRARVIQFAGRFNF